MCSFFKICLKDVIKKCGEKNDLKIKKTVRNTCLTFGFDSSSTVSFLPAPMMEQLQFPQSSTPCVTQQHPGQQYTGTLPSELCSSNSTTSIHFPATQEIPRALCFISPHLSVSITAECIPTQLRPGRLNEIIFPGFTPPLYARD